MTTQPLSVQRQINRLRAIAGMPPTQPRQRAKLRPVGEPISQIQARARLPNAAPQQQLVSQIDPAFPIFGAPTTESVRNNFTAAKTEIEALQDSKLDLTGGTMTGAIVFAPNQIVDGGVF